MWQHAPLAACFKQIEDAIKYGLLKNDINN